MTKTRKRKRASAIWPSAAATLDTSVYFAQMAVEFEAKRKQLSVEDALKEVPGVTAAMLVTFGKNGIKTVEDLAACATDDLAGWIERKGNRIKRHVGILDGLVVSGKECDAMILHARVMLGWIEDA